MMIVESNNRQYYSILWVSAGGREGGRERERERERVESLIFCAKSSFVFKRAIPCLFLYFFVISIQLTVCRLYKVCGWLDSNRGPLVSKETTLPTKPQPLPSKSSVYIPVFCNRWLKKIIQVVAWCVLNYSTNVRIEECLSNFFVCQLKSCECLI